eukprot:220294-Chlamydomonas_euryale.AAC.2
MPRDGSTHGLCVILLLLLLLGSHHAAKSCNVERHSGELCMCYCIRDPLDIVLLCLAPPRLEAYVCVGTLLPHGIHTNTTLPLLTPSKTSGVISCAHWYRLPPGVR